MIDLDDGDPFAGMDEAEYTQWCLDFEHDRKMDKVNEYLRELQDQRESQE